MEVDVHDAKVKSKQRMLVYNSSLQLILHPKCRSFIFGGFMKAQVSEETIAKVRDRARKNFSKGYNCSECVLEAVLAHIDVGLPKETLRVATGFGGGVGLFGDTCGAINGAMIAVSAVHGRDTLPEGENSRAVGKKTLYGKPGLYRLFNQIPNMVEDKYGNTLCREIAAQWRDDWLCRDHALYCREIITDLAEYAAQLIAGDKEELASRAFGENVENLKEDEGK